MLLIATGGIFYYRHQKQEEKIALQKEQEAKEKKAEEAKKEQEPTLYPWYTYRSVAHALGGLDGKDYLNSIDGFYAAYNKGYRVFEMDLMRTTDNVMVGKHHWGWKLSDPTTKKGEAVSYKKFKSTKIYGKYTPTSLADMFQAMDTYSDFYLMTDSKSDDLASVKKDFQVIVQTAKDVGKDNYESYLDRLVIQVYNQKMYNTIKEIYPFKHVIYTTYKQRDAAFYKMVRFCKANGIEGVTSPSNDINDYRMDILKEEGLYAYTHDINSSYLTREFMKLGVYGVYSDFLTPAEIDFASFRANNPGAISDLIKEIVPTYRNL